MSKPHKSLFRSLGPAFITASVVIGPGSIVTSSKVGATFGAGAALVLVVTTLLMIAMTGLSARLGIGMVDTPCQEVARRAGRGFAVLIGVAAFAITACFQFGNNLGILTALESLDTGDVASETGPFSAWGASFVVVLLNAALIVFMFALRRIYHWIERGMMLLVAVMFVAFATNLLFVLWAWAFGSWTPPDPPASPGEGGLLALIPRAESDGGASIVDPLGPLVALVGTTFSIAGAFFQAYLVRQRGWKTSQLRDGMVDTYSGITVLNLITLVIMLTAALVLRGAPIQSAGDIAQGLAPLYASAAQKLFCVGLLAASLSSLLVNAAIGGSLLADGFGLKCFFDDTPAKLFTLLGLLTGLLVAVVARLSESFDPVGLILFAQAATVIAWPMLAIVLVWLSRQKDLDPVARPPRWMNALCWCGLLLALILAPRTAYIVYLKVRVSREPAAAARALLPPAHAKAGHRVLDHGPRLWVAQIDDSTLLPGTHRAGQTGVVRPIFVVPKREPLCHAFGEDGQLFGGPGRSFRGHEIIRQARLKILIVSSDLNCLEDVPHFSSLHKSHTNKFDKPAETPDIREACLDNALHDRGPPLQS